MKDFELATDEMTAFVLWNRDVFISASFDPRTTLAASVFLARAVEAIDSIVASGCIDLAFLLVLATGCVLNGEDESLGRADRALLGSDIGQQMIASFRAKVAELIEQN